MKRGFTLLELIVVIIILGVLAIMGFTQYGRMIEKSRGAEARSVLSDLRKMAFAYYLEYGATPADLTSGGVAYLGTAADRTPSSCRSSHWFSYSYTQGSSTDIVVLATRCAASGKAPQGTTADTVNLMSNFRTGVDTWGGAGPY